MSKRADQLIPVTGGNKSGRVEIDNRGRNVWHWDDAQIDSTSILLKRLDNDALELEPTRSVPIPKGAKRARAKRGSASGDVDLNYTETLNVKASGGFDPYNHS